MKTTKIVGFQSGHDVSYCILENGIPVIHEEMERFSRKKMEVGDGLKFFFSRVSEYDDIKYFTFGNRNSRIGKWQSRCADKASDNKMRQIISKNDGYLYEFSHHLSHSANAFYTSNFDKSLIITIDGGGFEDDDSVTALSISEGIDNKINRIKTFPISEINFGGLWNSATKNIFGLSVGFPKGSQEGTVMAMATLGEAKYVHLFTSYRQQKLSAIARLSEQEKFNVAASLQKFTEQTLFDYISKIIQESGHENICFSGGVSLNCVMLGKIKNWFPQIKNIFCDPLPYDGGLALGSARYLWHHILGKPRRKNKIKNMSPYLGKTYSKKEVANACHLFKGQIKLEMATDQIVLSKISDQKIVAVFGGGSESGRRALGNRSILADPRNPNMKALINDKVKHRQWFRPLSPSILEEKVDEWFKEHTLSPYMSFALNFKEQMRSKVPAVVHFDGTGRLQTVNKLLNPWFHLFLTKWEVLSGVPILINTSFNDSEPIVETPEDALRCFLNTNIDYLYFFDYGIMVSKSNEENNG